MCSSPWSRVRTDGYVVEVPPADCPNGHPLRGNVTIGGDCVVRWYYCLTCHTTINRLHNEPVEWVSGEPGGFRYDYPEPR